MSRAAGRPRVAVVGSIMVDLIAYADPLPTAGQTVEGTMFQFGFGGKGANQAVSASRLGADVSFVGRVGDDVFGGLSIENLAAQAMDTAGVKVVDGVSTGVAPIWVEASGSNRIIIVAGANDRLLEAEAREELARIGPTDCVACQLEIPDAAVGEALRTGRKWGALTVLNPAPARLAAKALFGSADWLVPNEHEFELLWGAPPSDAEILAAAEAWECGLVVTLGEHGAAAALDGEVIRRRPPEVRPIDTTGAGDAFVGGLAVALAGGLPLASAIDQGNACGALSTEARGTQTSFPTRSQVDRRLELELGRP